ncbi:MAG: hypothetical protein KatS3mg038_2639 [Candidatus Kapaibacterium sp.]|nr:MAG: hypothetical protein KatS3mg038_2639 [Candidatus Kapabacteria bacterium]
MEHASKILLPAALGILLSSASSSQGQTVLGFPPTIVTATGRTLITPLGYRIVPASSQIEHAPSSVAAWIVPSRLGVRELQTAHALALFRADTWSAGAEVGSLGMDRYTEVALTTFGNIALSDYLTAGLALGYTMARARGFATEHLLTINAQMVFLLDSLTAIGVAGSNIGQTRRAGAQSGAVSQFRIGASRAVASGLLFDLDLVFPLQTASGVAAALRWDAGEFLSLRVAYATVPQSLEASVRLAAIEQFAVLATVHYHLALGASPSVGIAYRW